MMIKITGFINALKRRIESRFGFKLLFFSMVASVISFSMFGWSIFQSDNFNVVTGQFEFVSETGGGRISPAFILRDSTGVLYKIEGRHFDCFYRFELAESFEVSFVSFGGDNVVVACSQGEVALDIYDGLNSVKENLLREKVIALFSVFIFLFSIFVIFFYEQLQRMRQR